MTRSANRLLGLIVGAVFVLLGALGFLVTPGIGFFSTDGALFLGFFLLNPLQNVVHILFGAAIAMAALSNLTASALVNSVAGGLLLVLGLAGLFLVGAPTNVLALNSADNVLHFAAAAVLLAAGLGADTSQRE
jgi:hypothetical protein